MNEGGKVSPEPSNDDKFQDNARSQQAQEQDIDFGFPQRKLQAEIIESLRSTFRSPPELDLFAKDFEPPIDPDSLDRIHSALALHDFRTDEAHIALLKNIDISKLNTNALLKYHVLMFTVYDKRGEYSLSLEHIEQALALAELQGDHAIVLNCMISKGISLIKLDHPDVNVYHKRIFDYSERHDVTEGIAWAYHNWGRYEWEKGNYNDAILLYEQETSYRKDEGMRSYLVHMGFMAGLLEPVNRMKAISLYKEIIKVHSENKSDLLSFELAEIYYRLAVQELQVEGMRDDALKHAIMAKEIYQKEPGYEARFAWACGLVALCYAQLGKTESAQEFDDIKKTFLEQFGSSRDRFKSELAEAFLGPADNEDKLRLLEQVANISGNEELLLEWSLVCVKRLLDTGRIDASLSYLQHILERFDSSNAQLSPDDKEALSILYRMKAEAHSKKDDIHGNILALVRSVELSPFDLKLRWMLCNNALAGHKYDIAESSANFLIDKGLEGWFIPAESAGHVYPQS